LAFVCLVGLVVLYTVFSPGFSLPAPTGSYQVGTQTRHLVDASRRDPHSDDRNKPRELVIQIWYPIDRGSRGTVAPYRDRRGLTGDAARLAVVSTHSLIGAPLSRSQTQFPLLLYSPGWDGARTENTFQAEELASHGYIVAAMDHPYGSEVTVFPDGRAVYSKLVLGNPFSSQAAEESFVRTVEAEVRLRANDASFLLDELARLNADDPDGLLTGRIDLDHVGIFGFSLGGAVAAQACWLDRRFKAGVDMDGLLAAESERDGPRVPFLFLLEEAAGPIHGDANSAERREMEFDKRQVSRMRQLAKSDAYVKRLDGMGHSNFTDRPFYAPWPGPVHTYGERLLERIRFWPSRRRAEKAARIISRHLLKFFDEHLQAVRPTPPA
jgi:dienelactone hydrolase